MLSYNDLSCPVCGRQFCDTDDVVVCPVCGAPHHRECWFELGHCAFEADHGTEHQWTRPEPAEESSDPLDGICPQCGFHNIPGKAVCEKCGRPFDAPEGPRPYDEPREYRDNPNNPFSRPIVSDPYGGVDPKAEIDGVPVSDIAAFVGQNAAYYLPRFYLMDRNKSAVSFNFSACFFSEMWLMFRRMGTWFLVLFGITTLLNLPSYIQMVRFLSAVFNDYAYFIANGAANPELYTLSPQLDMIATILGYLGNVLNIVLLVFGNRLYMRFVLRRIRGLQQKYTDPVEYRDALQKAGGTRAINIVVAALISVLSFAVIWMIAGLL